VNEKHLYVIGGYNTGNDGLNETYCFNIKTNIMREKRQMINKRYWFGHCYINEFIYVAGGSKSFMENIKNCERYNMITDEWEEIPSFPETLHSTRLLPIEKRYIYSIGGFEFSRLFMERINIE
jgi:hypothetical protein